MADGKCFCCAIQAGDRIESVQLQPALTMTTNRILDIVQASSNAIVRGAPFEAGHGAFVNVFLGKLLRLHLQAFRSVSNGYAAPAPIVIAICAAPKGVIAPQMPLPDFH